MYDGPPLTLRAAIDEALTSNPTLVVLRRESDAARQRPEESRGLPPPTLSAQIWQWPINTVNPLNTNMFMFTMEQELPGRGKRDLRGAVGQKGADIANNDIAVSAREVFSNLKHAYVVLLVARKAAEVYGQMATLFRQMANVSESKYVAGRGSQQDALRSTVELSKLYDDALVSKQQAELAAAELNSLMGRSPAVPIGPLEELSDEAGIPAIETLTRLAIDHQPELQGMRLEIERAQAELAVANSDKKPDFMLQGGYMLLPHGGDAWTAQFGITWPSAPWAKARVDPRIAESTTEVSAAAARLAAAESALRLSIQQAYIKLTTAEQRAAVLQTTVLPQSRQAFEASRIAYESDRGDFLAMIEGQRTLLAAQLDYWRVLGDLAEARADLERAVGVDLPVPAGTDAR
jgi:outer membrane protein, heavy metal efflux system